MMASRVAEPLRLLHVVGGEQHRGPVVPELAQARPDEVADLRVEPGGRLVEDQHLGVVDEGTRDHEPAPHPARERLDPVPGPVGEGDEVEEGHEEGLQRLAGGPREVARVDPQVLHDREVGVEVVVLRNDADPRPHPAARSRHRLAEHGQLPAARRRMAEDHAKGRGLAGSVRTEQPEAPAPGHLEIDAVDDGVAAETLQQPPCLDHVRTHWQHPVAAAAHVRPMRAAGWSDDGPDRTASPCMGRTPVPVAFSPWKSPSRPSARTKRFRPPLRYRPSGPCPRTGPSVPARDVPAAGNGTERARPQAEPAGTFKGRHSAFVSRHVGPWRGASIPGSRASRPRTRGKMPSNPAPPARSSQPMPTLKSLGGACARLDFRSAGAKSMGPRSQKAPP